MRDSSMSGDVYDTSIPLHTQVDTFIESRYQFRLPYSKVCSLDVVSTKQVFNLAKCLPTNERCYLYLELIMIEKFRVE